MEIKHYQCRNCYNKFTANITHITIKECPTCSNEYFKEIIPILHISGDSIVYGAQHILKGVSNDKQRYLALIHYMDAHNIIPTYESVRDSYFSDRFNKFFNIHGHRFII